MCDVTSPKREKNLPHSPNSNTEAFGSHIPHVLPKASAFPPLSDKLPSPLTNIPPAPYHPCPHRSAAPRHFIYSGAPILTCFSLISAEEPSHRIAPLSQLQRTFAPISPQSEFIGTYRSQSELIRKEPISSDKIRSTQIKANGGARGCAAHPITPIHRSFLFTYKLPPFYR